MNHRLASSLFLVLAMLLYGGMARAGKHPRPLRHAPPAAVEERAHQEPMSLEEVVSRTHRRYEGRVLSVKERDGEYRIRLLTPAGRVKRLRLDPRTGRFR